MLLKGQKQISKWCQAYRSSIRQQHYRIYVTQMAYCADQLRTVLVQRLYAMHMAILRDSWPFPAGRSKPGSPDLLSSIYVQYYKINFHLTWIQSHASILMLCIVAVALVVLYNTILINHSMILKICELKIWHTKKKQQISFLVTW